MAEISYTKTNWVNNVTKLNADNMNHIENGIEAATVEINTLNGDLANKASIDYVDNAIASSAVSPTVETEAIIGGTKVTITDKDGAHEFDVMNGVNGTAGKSAYASAQDGGFTGTEAQFNKGLSVMGQVDGVEDTDALGIDTTVTQNSGNLITSGAVYTFAKAASSQVTPLFAQSVDELNVSGDTTKVYVLPDGYIYAYRTFKNYNLLKLSEVSYSSRLQDDVSGIISSNAYNAVTGWVPVKYGKNYCGSVLLNGNRNYVDLSLKRMNLKLSDGTIIVYNNGQVPYTYAGSRVIKIEYENAVAMMLHFAVADSGGTLLDISASEKLEAYQPMLVEGQGTDDTQTKATTYEYIDGDTEVAGGWYNTGHAFTPADYEDRILKLESDVAKLQESVAEPGENIQNPTSASPYYRDVDFGVTPSEYYKGVAETYTEIFEQRTDYATFIASWKSLVASHSGYVTETTLGTASDGQSIYLYDFKPVRIENQLKRIPKIIIIAGQHGFEKSNIYGLHYFVDNLLNRWNQSPALEYLRNHVELMIVPVLNTYGFDNLTYENGNGVNLNRNYDSNWQLVADTTSSQYGGAAPFDQPETQLVRDLLNSNKDALLVIDFHTNGASSVARYDYINFYGVCESTDSYYNRMIDAVAHNLSDISANFNLDYELSQPNTMFGFLNNSSGTGLLRDWATDNNFVSVLVEGFNGFPNDTPFVGKVYKANEEIIVNWLITAMYYLGK